MPYYGDEMDVRWAEPDPPVRLEIMPWCPRCETWHDSLEGHYDEIDEPEI